MKNRHLLTIVTFGFLVSTLWTAVSFAAEKKTLEGIKAPELRLSEFKAGKEGAKHSLDELLGRGYPVILSFFNTSCEPCKKELPVFEKIAAKYANSVKLFLVCLDDKPEKVLPAWIKENSVNLPVLLDPMGFRAGEKYGVTKYGAAEVPQLFIIGISGKIKKHLRGYHPDVEKILESEISALKEEAQSHPQTSGKNSLQIIYTNSANGYLESCDCPENPFGGLVRRVTVIKRLKEKYPDAITADSGDLFPPRDNPLLADYCLKIMETIKYDAIGVGDQELISGADFLKKNVERLPFVSANIQTCDEKLCYPLAKPYIIKQTGNIKAAILSVIDPAVFELFPQEKIKNIKILDYADYLKQTVPEIRKDVDIVVLLSHCGDDTDRKIASEISGIDVIVGGHSQTFHKEPLKIANTLIVQTGENGHRAGLLELKLTQDKKIASYTNEFVVLNKDIADDSAAKQMVVQYNAELKKNMQKLLK